MNWYRKLELEQGKEAADAEMARRRSFIDPANKGYAALKKKDPKRLAEFSRKGHQARWGDGKETDDLSSQTKSR